MFLGFFIVGLATGAFAGPATESYKDQYCTDPRTLQKHAAYTEWADAYSCTRHRCQPGGRNLAIYTVGCKRVEAPESAIECEEVVEDTNMQFPFCCTRLRCLVVVRGEVWTRVLGQPWETLPAAPWSHMYKMKKPPPPNGATLVKSLGPGPVYELAEPEGEGQKTLRASKGTDAPDCKHEKLSAVPDIVIALSTEPENKEHKSESRHKHRKTSSLNSITDDEGLDKETRDGEIEDAIIMTEKIPESSDEKSFRVTRKSSKMQQQAAWTEIPQKEWNEQEPPAELDNGIKEVGQPSSGEGARPALQALVDAIGSRMRDIENVVQRMSEKVHQPRPGEQDGSQEKQALSDAEIVPPRSHKSQERKEQPLKPKQPSPDGDHYKRFSARARGRSQRTTDAPPAGEQPLLAEEARLDGYFSDASNSVLRRASPKEPAQYVAAVETRHRSHIVSDALDDHKHTKHSHKRRGHKKHRKDKRKKPRQSSQEHDRNLLSLEENSGVVSV